MEIYRTMKNLALGFSIAAMPYICNSCNYAGAKTTEAREVIQRRLEGSYLNLEKVLKE